MNCGAVDMEEFIADLDLQLKLVCDFLDTIEESPNEEPLLQACSAIERVSRSVLNCVGNSEIVRAIHKKYCEKNFHEFVRKMLCDPYVCTNFVMVEALYVTFQKILATMVPEDLKAKLHTTDYIYFFVMCIIRDMAAFNTFTDVAIPVIYTYISDMEGVEIISTLKELGFHETVAIALEQCSSLETTAKIMKLLSCMVGKYYDHLNDVKPFMGAQIPLILLEKAKILGNERPFIDYFNVVMLLLTSDKELSLHLFEDGYLEKLLDAFENRSMLGIRTSVIHIIGNIALGGQPVHQMLLDRTFHTSLFSILHSMELSMAHPFLITGCCRVLSILASRDLIKRMFVESGCIELLLKIICTRNDNSEVQWRALNLLDSFMDIVSQEFILTSKILEAITLVLHNSKNGNVLYHSIVAFLDICELDSGARRLREVGAVQALQVAVGNQSYCNELPCLERYGMHALETQNLYTLGTSQHSILPKYPAHHLSDWPPKAFKEKSSDLTYSLDPAASVSSLSSVVLPLDETYYEPNTPIAPELAQSSREQLVSLGVDPEKPLFRIGRFYGNNHGRCRICDKEYPSEDLEIRPLSMTIEQYQHLIDCGWNRRGGVKMFRLCHSHDVKCCYWETRVLVKKFDHKGRKSYKKVLKRMPADRLTIETCRSHFNREAFDLYNAYHVKRFNYGVESEYNYCEHAVDTPITYQIIDGIEYGTFHQMYRLDGKLVAVEVVDIVPKGMVSVYMWYDVHKEIAKYSFGVYSILKDIEMVKSMSERNPRMEYYYLQGWNRNNKGLSYKSNYRPGEFYCPCLVTGWISASDVIESLNGEITDSEATSSCKNKLVYANSDEDSNPVKIKPKEDTNTKSWASTKEPESRSLPLDLKRYEEGAGTELDIGNIVICLNYAEFLCLRDLIKDFVKDESQRYIMEARFKELYVSLCPELQSQLVIDMMVCGTCKAT